MKALSRIISIVSVVAFIQSANATTLFSVEASAGLQADGWDFVIGGGDPDISFYLENSASNGDGDNNLDGDINNASGQAWGMSARDDSPFPGSTVMFDWDFDSDLEIGQTLSIDMDNGFIDAGDRWVGFELDSGGFSRFQFRFQGGDDFYEIGTPDSGFTATAIPFTDEGLNIAFTLTGTDSYDLRVTTYGNGQVYNINNQTLDNSGGIERIEIFNREAGTGLSNNAYFNNLAVTPEPGTALLVFTGFAALYLRRRLA